MSKVKRLILIGFLIQTMISAGHAQTSVDLRTQSRNVDFTGAAYTRPVKTGNTLPATCNIGDLFFKSNDDPGLNLYGCAQLNTWARESGAGLSFTAESNGVPAGTESTVNYAPGAGIASIISDTGSQLNIQTAVDTSVVETFAVAQAGSALLCASSSGSSTNYSCAMQPTLAAYSAGMILHWLPDVNGAGGPTLLNIDSLGNVPVKLPDGVGDPGSSDIVGGRLLDVWYDGSGFRLMQSESSGGGSATWNSLAGKPSAFAPAPHAATHQNGGSDEISTAVPAANAIPKAGISGKLAQGWIDFTGYQTLLGFTAENIANKAQPSGYASLDSSGKVPASQLPASGASISGGAQISVSGGSVSYNPFDFDILAGRDDFCSFSPANIASSSFLNSAMHWAATGANAALSVGALPGSSCGIQIVTATANWASLTSGPAINPATSSNWKLYAAVVLPSIVNTLFSFSANLYTGQVCSGANTCVGISAVPSAANFKLNSCSSYSCTAVDTGVPVVAGSTYKMYLRAGTAGTILASINGSPEVSVSSNIPNGNLAATFLAAPNNASQSTLDVLAFAYQTAGN
jgi:hypothetical protein